MIQELLIPQRFSNESFEEYKMRRKLGNMYANGTNKQRAFMRHQISIKNFWEKNYKKEDANETS